MTTPDEPRDTATSPSETGWPVDEGEYSPPLETSDPTDAEEEGWPSVPDPEIAAEEWTSEAEPEAEPEEGTPEAEPVAEPEEWTPEAEPEPELPVAASEELSVDVAPPFGRDEEPEHEEPE